MEFFAEYWSLIIAAIAILVVVIYSVYMFIKKPRGQQLTKVQEWLLWAVTKAEKELGGGTGQLKLRYVYDLFTTRFPVAARFISFDFFSILVDKALERMRHLLQTNGSVEQYVEKGGEQ